MEKMQMKYKQAYRFCKCGSKIFYNLYRPINIPELCDKCQEIADMRQAKLHEFDGNQKKIYNFEGNNDK